MKKTSFYFLIPTILTAFLLCFNSVFALASDIQGDFSTETNVYNGYNVIQNIGEGNGTTINNFKMYLKYTGGGGGVYYDAQVIGWNDSGYSSYYTQSGTQTQSPTYTCDGNITDDVFNLCTFTFNSPLTLQSGKYYYLQVRIQGAGSPTMKALGSASDVVEGNCSGGSCGSVLDLAYVFNGTFAPPNTTTRIISVSPESNVTIVPFTQSSTTKYAPFDIDLLEYYNNVSTSTIAYITTILSNKDIPAFTYTKTVLDVATGTATTSYSIYNQVPFGLYDYTIRLFDSNLDVIDSTTTTNIQFGSTTLPSITFEDIYGATSTQVFTATEQSVISYINLINLLKTKAPFGYFYIVKNSLSNLNTTSTSTVNIVIPSHLKTYFFTPFDLAFSGILWFYFIVFFYKRLKHITI